MDELELMYLRITLTLLEYQRPGCKAHNNGLQMLRGTVYFRVTELEEEVCTVFISI